mgnify:CR=1 FL=1
MNSVNMIGRLGQDPELKYTTSGMAICTLSLALDQGKEKEVGWVNVVCMEKTAENVAQYMNKGDEIGVSGRLAYRSWEQEGKKRSALEVVANRVDFLRKKGEGGGNGGGGANRDEERAAAYGRQPAAPAEEDPDPFADE